MQWKRSFLKQKSVQTARITSRCGSGSLADLFGQEEILTLNKKQILLHEIMWWEQSIFREPWKNSLLIKLLNKEKNINSLLLKTRVWEERNDLQLWADKRVTIKKFFFQLRAK